MTYKQLGAEFFYGCFQVGLSVELLICKLMRDTFGWVSQKFELLCQDGMNQMARLRGAPAPVEQPRDFRPPVLWSRRRLAS